MSIIPENLRWRNWAVDKKDGEAMTGQDLLDFVNNELFPSLKKLPVDENTPTKKLIVKSVFEDSNNFMKDGILLRKVINVIDEIDFTEYQDRHAFGEIYENILKQLQSAGNAGEFYTPRAVTDFMVEMIQPKLTERVADFACGTGGFLTSTIKYLDKKVQKNDDRKFTKNLFGIEKKPLPYMLCVTNLLLHDIDSPNIIHGNSFEKNVRDYKKDEKYDVVIMNPPYGGSEIKEIQNNFPLEFRGGETADLFMSVIMYRLRENGRACVVLPDGFLFGTDSVKINLKKKLFKEFNLHTIVRLPSGVFAPYTPITTNLVFFNNHDETKETWFYRVETPGDLKRFSKTRPFRNEHLDDARKWFENKVEIEKDGKYQAKKYTVDELIKLNYNLDLCGYSDDENEVLDLKTVISDYIEKRKALESEIEEGLEKLKELLDL